MHRGNLRRHRKSKPRPLSLSALAPRSRLGQPDKARLRERGTEGRGDPSVVGQRSRQDEGKTWLVCLLPLLHSYSPCLRRRQGRRVRLSLGSHATPLSVPWALTLLRRRIPIPEIRDSLNGVRPVAAQVLLVRLLDTPLD